jgi:hypothetical protein
MRRREFTWLIVGAAIAWPLAPRSETAIPIIGFLSARSFEDSRDLVTAFDNGLRIVEMRFFRSF